MFHIIQEQTKALVLVFVFVFVMENKQAISIVTLNKICNAHQETLVATQKTKRVKSHPLEKFGVNQTIEKGTHLVPYWPSLVAQQGSLTPERVTYKDEQ